MVRAIKHRTDMLLFRYSVSEVFIINQCAEFERIFHIPIFFVPIFFANVSFVSLSSKKSLLFLFGFGYVLCEIFLLLACGTIDGMGCKCESGNRKEGGEDYLFATTLADESKVLIKCRKMIV